MWPNLQQIDSVNNPRFSQNCCLFSDYPEDGGSKLFQNVGHQLPNYQSTQHHTPDSFNLRSENDKQKYPKAFNSTESNHDEWHVKIKPPAHISIKADRKWGWLGWWQSKQSTGTISKSFRKHLNNIPGMHNNKKLQKTATVGLDTYFAKY